MYENQDGLRKLEKRLGIRWHGGAVAAGVSRQGYSIAQFAQDKQLPEAFLLALGIGDRKYGSLPAVGIPYRDEAGCEVLVRYRIAGSGQDKFRNTRGQKLIPYGLDHLDRSKGFVHLVEGESDTLTLWVNDEPAIGIPGASSWKQEWAQRLAGLTVYVWQEPDQGGQTFATAIGKDLPDMLVMQAPAGRKDISDCHLHGDDVPALMAQLRAGARPWRELQRQVTDAIAAEARRKAQSLLLLPHVLDEFLKLCRAEGLVGEERTVKLLYLALTSRLLEHPVSVVVKGPSSGGKSFTVEVTLRAFPISAYYALSSMSERSLAYSTEPLEHRYLVLYEAAGLAGDFATYLVRTLLSEGCIRYETVEKTGAGLKPRLIERAGPTGLIVTTTAPSLHPENETRMFSVTVQDTAQQTSGVLSALAARADGREPQPVDFSSWHALQDWLQLAGSRVVTIPYAHELAELADARAVRLRRDFAAVLNLVRAHAILHQETRGRDRQGRIVATVDDYAAVYDLVIDIVSEGVQACVKPETREVVEAVMALCVPNAQPVTFKRVGEHLGLDKSAARRRCEVALKEGYLINRQERRGQAAVLSLGDTMPADRRVLPTPDELIHRSSLQTTVPPCHRPGEASGSSDTPQAQDAAGAGAEAGQIFLEAPEPRPEEWQLSFLEEADNLAYESNCC